jgi:hypothetical protein
MASSEVLGLAKQGDPAAIATLMNQVTQPRGISVRVKAQDDCLHFLFEAEQIPKQQTAVSFVRTSMDVLKVQTFKKLMVYGRQQDSHHTSWHQMIPLQSYFEAPDILTEPMLEEQPPETEILMPPGDRSEHSELQDELQDINLQEQEDLQDIDLDINLQEVELQEVELQDIDLEMLEDTPEETLEELLEEDLGFFSEEQIVTEVYGQTSHDAVEIEPVELDFVEADPVETDFIESDPLESDLLESDPLEISGDLSADIPTDILLDLPIDRSSADISENMNVLDKTDSSLTVDDTLSRSDLPMTNALIRPTPSMMSDTYSAEPAELATAELATNELAAIAPTDYPEPSTKESVALVKLDDAPLATWEPGAGIPESLKRPESVMYIIFSTLLVFWEAYVTILDELAPDTSLSCRKLAERLKVSKSTVRKRKREADFSEWSQSLDPEGIAWVYQSGGLYAPRS